MNYFNIFYVSFKIFKHFRVNIFQYGIQYGRHLIQNGVQDDRCLVNVSIKWQWKSY